jgi:hypothetical protein
MRFLSLFLCPLVALTPIWAQSTSAGGGEPAVEVPFHVHLVDEPGPAPTRSTSEKGYVVQVTNGTGAPVAGAAVALRLPEDGPTGRFANGLRAWVAYSDTAGIARFPVIQWGETGGLVELSVTAAKDTLHAGLTIAQQIGQEHPSASIVSIPVEAASVAKPAPPPEPRIVIQTPEPGTVSMPLADTVPLSVSPLNTSQLDIPKAGSSGASGPHTLTPNPPSAGKEDSAAPTVSITNSASGASGNSHKKLWLLVAVGTGAGVGALMALKGAHGGGGSSTTSSSGVSVGTPTISVGH